MVEFPRKNTSMGRLFPLPSGDVGINAPSPRPNARRFSLIPIDLSEANTTDTKNSSGLIHVHHCSARFPRSGEPTQLLISPAAPRSASSLAASRYDRAPLLVGS